MANIALLNVCPWSNFITSLKWFESKYWHQFTTPTKATRRSVKRLTFKQIFVDLELLTIKVMTSIYNPQSFRHSILSICNDFKYRFCFWNGWITTYKNQYLPTSQNCSFLFIFLIQLLRVQEVINKIIILKR